MVASTNAGVGVPGYQPDETQHRRNIAQWCQWVNQGHLSNTGTVTLTANAATTTVTDSRVSLNSVPVLQAATANAASAVAATYISTVTNGSFTITHANNATADRTFKYALLG